MNGEQFSRESVRFIGAIGTVKQGERIKQMRDQLRSEVGGLVNGNYEETADENIKKKER